MKLLEPLRCPIHGCFRYGAGRCDITPADQRCKDCPCDKGPVICPAQRPIVTIFVPDGYADAADFLKDCAFEEVKQHGAVSVRPPHTDVLIWCIKAAGFVAFLLGALWAYFYLIQWLRYY